MLAVLALAWRRLGTETRLGERNGALRSECGFTLLVRSRDDRCFRTRTRTLLDGLGGLPGSLRRTMTGNQNAARSTWSGLERARSRRVTRPMPESDSASSVVSCSKRFRHGRARRRIGFGRQGSGWLKRRSRRESSAYEAGVERVEANKTSGGTVRRRKLSFR